jgi:hypothetical protein
MKRSWTNGSIPVNTMSKVNAIQVDRQQPTETGVFAAASVQPHSESLLQASRRIDWRFLLPNPSLERVAYFGPARGPLVTSLELFAEQLTMFVSAQVGTYHREQYDVVVVSHPTHAVLQQAVQLMRPGGSLYVEAHGLFWPSRWLQRAGILSAVQRPRLWHPADYVTALKQLGLAEAHTFWFWPNFDACTQIIPLDDPVVLPYVFATRHAGAGFKARLRALYMRWLLRSGWIELTLPCFGIVAQAGPLAPQGENGTA